ncbi:MAG: hypothetical protein ACJAUD_001043 [Crocinitomicaceae bacterium]|jgi:hypothetical protein
MKAKTIYLSLILVGITFFLSSTTAYGQKTEKITAVYQGINDDGAFDFIDDKKKHVLFSEIGEELEIDLYEDEFIGSKFTITWEEDSYEIYDDEGEPTGTFEKIMRILAVEEAN